MKLNRPRLALVLLFLLCFTTQLPIAHHQSSNYPVLSAERKTPTHKNFQKFQKARLLQSDNPSNPTGPNMTVNIDYLQDVGKLTPELVNNMSAGQNLSGNHLLYDDKQGEKPTTNATKNQKGSNTSGSGQSNINTGGKNVTNISNTTQINSSGSSGGSPPKVGVSFTPPIGNQTTNQVTVTQKNTTTTNNTSSTIKPPYKNFNVQDIVATAEFKKVNSLARASIIGYINQNQILQFLSQDLGNNNTAFRMTVRTSAAICQLDLVLYANGSAYLSPKKYLTVKRSETDLNTLAFLNIDRLLKANYPQLTVNSTVDFACQQQIPAINSTVHQIKYKANSSATFLFTVQVFQTLLPTSKILSIQGTPSRPLSQSFSSVPLWTTALNTDYNIMMADSLLRRFVSQNSQTFRKNFTIMSISNSLSSGCDLNRYHLRYLMDDLLVEVGAKLNLTSRKTFLEYYKERGSSTVVVFQPKEGYQQLSYPSFVNNATYKLVDQTARAQYPEILTSAVISQVDVGRLADNRTAFHIVYMANGKYYEVTYP